MWHILSDSWHSVPIVPFRLPWILSSFVFFLWSRGACTKDILFWASIVLLRCACANIFPFINLQLWTSFHLRSVLQQMWNLISPNIAADFFTSNLCGHQPIAAKITAQLRTNKNSKTWHHTTLIWWCMVDSNVCSCLLSKIEICNTKMLIMNYLMEKSMWKNHVCICKVLHVLLWNCLNFQQNVLISLKQMMKSVTSYPLLFVACEIVSDNCDDVESFEWIISRRHICH